MSWAVDVQPLAHKDTAASSEIDRGFRGTIWSLQQLRLQPGACNLHLLGGPFRKAVMQSRVVRTLILQEMLERASHSRPAIRRPDKGEQPMTTVDTSRAGRDHHDSIERDCCFMAAASLAFGRRNNIADGKAITNCQASCY